MTDLNQESAVIKGPGYGFDYTHGRQELLEAKKTAAAEQLAREAITGVQELTYAEKMMAQSDEQLPPEQGEIHG